MSQSPHRLCETTGERELWCQHCDTVQQLAADDRVLRTVAQLRRIPDLAALVEVAADAPIRIPTGKARRGKTTGSPMPTVTAARALCRDSLAALSEAVRVVAEEQRRTLDDWPDLAESPSFTSECGYLLKAVEVWSGDEFCRQWVTGAAHKVHESLSRWVGEQIPRPPKYTCPKCGGRLHKASYSADGEGQQLGCEDCGSILHPKDIAHHARMGTPASLPDIAAMLDVTERTLQRWVSAGLAQPVTGHEPHSSRPALYLPADFVRIKSMVKAS